MGPGAKVRLGPGLGSGLGPELGPGVPQRRAISPQKDWSPKKGQTSVGLAALSPAAVVPAPPWCTTAATFGSNQSCGHGPTSKHNGSSATRSLDQPLCTSTRTPLARAAALMVSCSRAVSAITIEPKPTKMGGVPCCSHASKKPNCSSTLLASPCFTPRLPTTYSGGGWRVGCVRGLRRVAGRVAWGWGCSLERLLWLQAAADLHVRRPVLRFWHEVGAPHAREGDLVPVEQVAREEACRLVAGREGACGCREGASGCREGACAGGCRAQLCRCGWEAAAARAAASR